jgi:hypothetical protein
VLTRRKERDDEGLEDGKEERGEEGKERGVDVGSTMFFFTI